MRKYILLISLLLFSSASALTISIDSEETKVSSFDTLTINYVISLNTEESTNYAITLFNNNDEFVVLNNTQVLKDINDSFIYDVSGLASGNYSLALRVSNPSITTTELAPSNITILSELDFRVIVPDVVFVRSSNDVFQVTMINNGNTDLSISAFFRNAQSDITISPQSFPLSRKSTKTLSMTFARPEEDYQATLVVISSTEGEEITNEYPIRVRLPIINLDLIEVNAVRLGDDSTLDVIINNTGNVEVNATLSTRTFSIDEGFITQQETFTISSSDTYNHSKSFTNKRVIGIKLTYAGLDGDVMLMRELSILNKIPFDIKLTKERLTLLAALIGIFALVIYFKFKRKKRP
jgi:hypothetical protein